MAAAKKVKPIAVVVDIDKKRVRREVNRRIRASFDVLAECNPKSIYPWLHYVCNNVRAGVMEIWVAEIIKQSNCSRTEAVKALGAVINRSPAVIWNQLRFSQARRASDTQNT